MSAQPDEWKLVTEFGLARYPCGVAAGELVRVRSELLIRDHTGCPTGKVHAPGEIWTVLEGVAMEPGTVWLREPEGGSHTWDGESFWERFERTGSSSKEIRMNWNKSVRQTHRWVSIAFTVTVIVNIVVMATGGGGMPPPWVTYSPLLPLALLLLTGLYLFVLPYATKWRSARRAGI